MRHIKYAFFLTALLGVSACQQLPIKLTSNETACSESTSQSANEFYSYAVGTSLNEAKNNARADLARQISSSISVTSSSDIKDINGRVDVRHQSSTQVSSDNIPLDHHRFDKACLNNGQYHIGVRLAKKDLINTVNTKLNNSRNLVTNLLQRIKTTSSYERYVIRTQLVNETNTLQLYDRLMTQYGDPASQENNSDLLRQAQRAIDKHSKLNIAIKTEASVKTLLPLLESSLTEANLTYGKQSRDTAVIIHLNGKIDNKRAKNHYVTHLNAQLIVRRTDTNELLAKLDLGKQTATSSLGFDEALNSAIKNITPNVKRQLKGDSHTVRSKLGLQ